MRSPTLFLYACERYLCSKTLLAIPSGPVSNFFFIHLLYVEALKLNISDVLLRGTSEASLCPLCTECLYANGSVEIVQNEDVLKNNHGVGRQRTAADCSWNTDGIGKKRPCKRYLWILSSFFLHSPLPQLLINVIKSFICVSCDLFFFCCCCISWKCA